MEALTTDSAAALPALKNLTKGRSSASPKRYVTLSQVDRDHAASLTRSCHLSADAQQVSKTLAHEALFQTIRTSVPLMIGDFVTMWSLLLLVTTAIERLVGIPHDLVTRQTALVASVLLLPIARLKGLYPAIGTSPAVEFREIVQSVATALCIFAGIGIAVESENWMFLIVSALTTMLFAIPVFPAMRYTVRGLFGRFAKWGSPVLVYAPADVAADLFERMCRLRPRGLRACAVLLRSDDYWAAGESLTKRGIPTYDVRNVLNCALKYDATWIVVGAREHNDEQFWGNEAEIQADLNAIPNRMLLTSAGLDCGMWDRAHTIGSVSGLWQSSSRHCKSQAALKRFIDIAVTSIACLLLSPLIIGIALAIRLSAPGPILYSQKRLGYGGKLFSAWKFRSMVPDADRVLQQVLDSDPVLRKEWDETHKLKRDPRVTWIGRLIRATSLDELPQLWNILCGDMSLVGPRPIVDSPTYDAAYVREYPQEFATYCSVRPGLTGLWQVTCRNSGVYEFRIYWDMYYIRNWSLWLDLYIILRTIRTVLLREGAY